MSKKTGYGALDGLRVVDLSRVLAGPSAAQILSDHGADVIKVEPPQGDETRDWGPPFKDEISSYFAGLNRNKRSIALDLSGAGGHEVLMRLLETADVLLENFKIGTMEKWGVGSAALADRFPRLVHGRITGFGKGGPFDSLPGYDAIGQALSGLMSINGHPECGPVRVGVPVVDLSAGMNLVIGILMALFERERSGKGQFVEVALYDSGVALLHPQGANYFMSGKEPGLMGDSHPNIAPYDQFPTKTRNVFLGAGNNRQFRILCEHLGRAEMAADPRFASNGLRVQNRDVLNDWIREALTDWDAEELSRTLLAMGVPCGAVMAVSEVMGHAQTKHRDMVWEADGFRGVGIPTKMGRTPGKVRSGPPAFASAGRAILSELGYSEEEVEGLIEAGVTSFERKTV
ncbi:MAG: CaiB/BaiF CoA-transferase family protein [Proteobacteria bacterium]|nr:CaiB/BaiF CoA-transferase family protein [Pseudomonadota bacterium]